MVVELLTRGLEELSRGAELDSAVLKNEEEREGGLELVTGDDEAGLELVTGDDVVLLLTKVSGNEGTFEGGI